MSNTGSCFCGNIKIEYTGEPELSALCHCADCRKISGGFFSANFLVPSKNFKLVSGTPKEFTKTADSGKSITSCFCPECGSTLYRYGDTFGGLEGSYVIKTGVLDDKALLDKSKPGVELYAPERIAWLPAADGAQQVDAMPPA